MTALRTSVSALALAATLSLTACKPDNAIRQGEPVDKGYKSTDARARDAARVDANLKPAPAPAPTSPTGSVIGIIRFAGKPPARVKIDMSQDPACSFGGENFSEQIVVEKERLANTFLYIRGVVAGATTPSTPVIMDQKGCRYTPHVIGVMRGGTVEFRNSDPTMHNVHTMPLNVGNKSVDVSQGPRGAAQSIKLDTPETMLPVRCNNHPWMNAFINVTESPFFAVSASDGKFEIHGLPPGNYTLAAIHEKLGEQTTNITIKPNGTATADFAFVQK